MRWLIFILLDQDMILDALSGEKMKKLGWEPTKSVRDRINQVTKWTLENERWIKL